MTEFVEKTGEAVPGEINAGAYVLERSVLDLIPPEREVSIEREVFPRLVGDGLGALRLDGYWMDIGTPERYLQASWDILEGRVATRVRPTAPGLLVGAGAEVDAGATVGPRAVVSAGLPGRRRGRGARLGPARRLQRRRRRQGQRLGPRRRASRSRPGARLDGAIVGRDERVPARVTMIDDVLGIPDQLRDALWRIESARLEPADAAGVMVCGMGGSAIGGDLAAAALGDRLTRPLITVRGYALPSWATPEWTVLCSSYSGNTEETLACFAAAEALGARRIVVSTGGALVDGAREAGVPVVGLPGIFQPRAAVAYMFTVAAEVAALAGAAPRDPHRDRRRRGLPRAPRPRRCRPAPPRSPPSSTGTVPVVYGADLTAPVARRWKTPGQRERQAPRLLLRAARGRPQRALRLGRRPRRASPPSSSRTATSTRACAAASS